MEPTIYLQIRTLINEVVTDKNYFLPDENWGAIEEMTKRQEFKFLLGNLSSLVLIYNIKTGYYEFVGDNIKSLLGYEPTDCTGESGVDFIYTMLSEEQASIFVNTLMKEIFSYIFQHATPETGKDFKFTCCLKFKDKFNNAEWYLLDTNILQTDASGLPVRTIITCTNIHRIKKDDIIYYDILKKDGNGIYKPVVQRTVNDSNKDSELTEREYEIVCLVCRGYTNNKIASELFISPNTVQTHRKKIMKKLQCKGTGELINYAYSRGIV